ncbi:MAG: CoA-binding protein, partial [Deltaproteobacteria bacterium]|nr:CoA-binding protein [Deltaproteobacteria bacterium]
MLTSIKKSPLYKIANPKSIAFWGASNNFMSMGTQMLDSIKLLKFKGPVYPIHPKEDTVLGFKAYPGIADLPEIPDLAVIVLPTKIVSR